MLKLLTSGLLFASLVYIVYFTTFLLPVDNSSDDQLFFVNFVNDSSLISDKVLQSFSVKPDLRVILYGSHEERVKQFVKSTTLGNKSIYETNPFVEVMRQRRAKIKQQCYNLGRSGTRGQFTDNYELEVYYAERNILYCPVFKATTTRWYQNLLILWVNTTDQQLPKDNFFFEEWHRRIRVVMPVFNSPEEINNVINQPETNSFMVVRHPYQRLVSAYVDKFSKYNPWFYTTYGNDVIHKYRPKYIKMFGPIEDNHYFKSRNILTFWEFVQWVIDTDPDDMNEHWQPMYKLCSLCTRSYKYILKFENLVLETQHLLHLLDIESIIPPTQWNHPGHTAKENLVLTQMYFEEISPQDIEELFDIYEIDFKLFDYSPSIVG